MSKILSIDCESNGLHGYIFAIGAVLIDTDDPGNTNERFTGYVDIRLFRDVDSWVVQNVLPFIHDLDLYDTLLDLYEEFWSWYCTHKPGAIVLVDFGFPVEARLFQYLINQDLPNRAFNGPFPLHELGTLLLAVGAPPDDTNRREWYVDLKEFDGMPAILKQHNPLDDAIAASWCAVKALRILGQDGDA